MPWKRRPKTDNVKKPANRGAVRYTQNIISTIVLSIVALSALVFCVILLLRNASLERSDEIAREELKAFSDADYVTPEEVEELMQSAEAKARAQTQETLLNSIRTGLTSGESMTNTVRRLFPNELIVSTADNRYAFVEIDQTLETHGFEDTDFVYDDDGFLIYQGADTSVEQIAGIDVSQYLGEIEWDKVAADGVRFVMIRAGLRRSRDGVLQADERFAENIEGASQSGLMVGVYFFSSALNEAEAEAEAHFLLNTIAPYADRITLPVAIDIEPPESAESRHFELTMEQASANIRAFVKTIEEAGYQPLIYGNVRTFTLFADHDLKRTYPVWIAYYGIPQYYPYAFHIWQYSGHGLVDGINGEVDLNLMVKRFR